MKLFQWYIEIDGWLIRHYVVLATDMEAARAIAIAKANENERERDARIIRNSAPYVYESGKCLLFEEED